jgi:hypothetical protein
VHIGRLCVVRLPPRNELLVVEVRVDVLRDWVQVVGAFTKVLSHNLDRVFESIKHVLERVNEPNVVVLDLIQVLLVLTTHLIHKLVHSFDRQFVFFLCLIRSQLLLSDFAVVRVKVLQLWLIDHHLLECLQVEHVVVVGFPFHH